MLHHLTGKPIPGIPRSLPLSADLDRRTDQLLQQHGAMLTFLRWAARRQMPCDGDYGSFLPFCPARVAANLRASFVFKSLFYVEVATAISKGRPENISVTPPM